MTNLIIGIQPAQVPRNSDLGELAYQDRIPFGRLPIAATLQLGKQHIGQVIDVTSGTFALTTDSAASLKYGWWANVRNSGTGVVTLPTADAVAYTLQPGQSKTIYTDGVLFYADGVSAGMSLLATLTPTVAATVDFLTAFTAGYDNYLIVASGLGASADDLLHFRFANAGVVDTGSNYYSGVVNSAITSATTSGQQIVSTTTTAGLGASFAMEVLNANDAVNLKIASVRAMSQSAATPAYFPQTTGHAYKGANAISGIRFFWNGGANFKAGGKIRVYGYANSL